MDAGGPIVRLQIQERSLKVGPTGRQAYDPFGIVTVPALTLSERGTSGSDDAGATYSDVHHLDHVDSKSREGVNGISILFTGHYAVMRERFGTHLADGIAGESILVDHPNLVHEDDVRDGITIATATGTVVKLHDITIAEPCVEFTRFTLGYPPASRSDSTVTAALSFLRGGMRGFYARYTGEPISIRLGDTVRWSAR